MTVRVIKNQTPAIYDPLDDPHRFKVLYGGRSAARSWTIARKLLRRGMKKPLTILCTRELQKSIKDSVHKLLSNQIKMLQMDGFYQVTDRAIRGKNGTEFIFLGIRFNTDEIRSMEGVDICWIEEAHNLTEDSWDVIEPTIRKEGSEMWLTFNTRFKFDHVYQTFCTGNPPPGSLVLKTNYTQNPFLTEVSRQSAETMKERDYEKYLHIWMGDLKELAEGAIFGKQVTKVKQAGHLLEIPVANSEVDVYFDLGKNDHTAMWFHQWHGLQHRFIDFYHNRLEDVDHYVRVLKALGYNYGTFYMPHDAEHERLGMANSIADQFENAGISPVEIVPRIQHKQTAISLARDILPQCWFHKGDFSDTIQLHADNVEIPDDMLTRDLRMDKGWETLCNYRFKYRDDDDVFQSTPHHDWASNGADAFMQFAQTDHEIKDTDSGEGESYAASGWMG